MYATGGAAYTFAIWIRLVHWLVTVHKSSETAGWKCLSGKKMHTMYTMYTIYTMAFKFRDRKS